MIGRLSGASTDVAHSHVSAERGVEREIDAGSALCTDNESDQEQGKEAKWARARIQKRSQSARVVDELRRSSVSRNGHVLRQISTIASGQQGKQRSSKTRDDIPCPLQQVSIEEGCQSFTMRIIQVPGFVALPVDIP